MKRLLPILLILCLMLGACGKTPEATEPVVTEEPTTQPTTEATEPPTEAPTEPPVIRHPLTGEELETPYTGRITAVVTPNNSAAVPHYGISQAEVLYEIEAEGSVTRCLMLFSDLSQVDKIGPIRSSRTYLNCLAVAYDAPIVHCGGSSFGRLGRYDSSGKMIPDWAHIDEMYNGSYFFRDTARNNSGYAWEYCLFTSGERLINCLAEREYNKETPEGTDFGLLFGDESATTAGESAQKVTVKFYSGKTTTMTFDAETGNYLASQHGGKFIDGTTGEQLSFKNVIILQTAQRSGSMPNDSQTRKYYRLIGEGEGFYACDGKIIPIKWSRENLEDPFVYTTKDGAPITLGIGKTYVAVTSNEATSTYE